MARENRKRAPRGGATREPIDPLQLTTLDNIFDFDEIIRPRPAISSELATDGEEPEE